MSLATRRSMRHRAGRFASRRRRTGGFDLQLTSLMDALVIILVFMLKSFQASTHSFDTPGGIELPQSASPDLPKDSLQVIISRDSVSFENRQVARMDPSRGLGADDLDEEGRRIRPLYDALVEARLKSERLRVRSGVRSNDGKPLPFEGVIAIQADRRIPYDTLRRVLYTAAAAEFKLFRFLALPSER